MLVQVDRDPQLLTDPSTDRAGDLHAIVHSHTGDRDEGAHVGRPEARVRPFVPAHVYDLGRVPGGAERRFRDPVGWADERDYGPVRVATGIHIQQPHALDTFDDVGDLLDDGVVLPLGEVGYALDDPLHALPPLSEPKLCVVDSVETSSTRRNR
jgi:hypothetical protein